MNNKKENKKLVVEVGMELDKPLVYFHDMLVSHGLRLSFTCITHDLYYTKENLDGLTENQMKNACVRLRKLEGIIGINKDRQVENEEIKAKEKELICQGYRKVFDTIKIDFQYKKPDWYNYIQLQDIKDVGLLVYWENEKFYHLPLDEQRRALFEELNSYGFNFQESDLGVDKLRTLYYGKKMYSKNQNA